MLSGTFRHTAESLQRNKGPQGFHWQAARSQRPVQAFARKRSPITEGLNTVLKDELKIEKERYRTPDTVLEGPPSNFLLEDKPNSNTLLLTRSFGSEDIVVEVDLDTQRVEEDNSEDEEDEEELESLLPVVFVVNIIKNNHVLGFRCETNGEDISVTHVSLDGTDSEEEDELAPYTGPVFTELDDTLQQAFTDYLEERGITAEFGHYLVELVHDKLEVEYMNWLTRVQEFVSS